MFTETWRRRWGLRQAPFAHEDADHDPLLDRVDSWAVHPSYERLVDLNGGPSSAVIFGERGSGKSALRRSVAKGLKADGKSLTVEVTDVDPWLEIFKLQAGQGKQRANGFARLDRADLIDLMLSAATMRLGESLKAEPGRLKKLSSSQRAELCLLVAAYHPDFEGDREEQVSHLLSASRSWWKPAGRAVFAVLGAAVCLAPLVQLGGRISIEPSATMPVALVGAGMLGLMAAHSLWRILMAHRAMGRITAEMRITAPDRRLMRRALTVLPRSSAPVLTQGAETREDGRYRLLQGLIQLVREMGWSGLDLLVDRIDESTLLQARVDCMGSFIDPVLEHKLLQLDGLGLKLFLPVELTPMVRGAGPERLRRMRLDKATLVDEMRWSGQELLELADRRLVAASNGPATCLGELLGEDLDLVEMKDALHTLGTPRLAFAFLRDLFEDHARELPDDLPRDSADWRVNRGSFERQRAASSDRARTLRRVMRQTSVIRGTVES